MVQKKTRNTWGAQFNYSCGTSISALTKCDSRGEHCPYGSHCKEIALDSYRCVCNAGFKPVEVGEKLQTCEGKLKP